MAFRCIITWASPYLHSRDVSEFCQLRWYMYLALIAIMQWGFFSVPHFLQLSCLVVLNDELLKESHLLYFVFNSTLLSLGYSMWILLRFVKFCRRRKTIIRFIYNIFIATSYLSTCLFCLMEKFKLLKLKTLFYYKSWQIYKNAYRQKGFQKAIIQPLHFSL